ncbi:MAG: aspartate aminotransferase family protein [Firmicutes bacterium]|nr:aspartate aminotransferase family protein [Bacillota bacterium]
MDAGMRLLTIDDVLNFTQQDVRDLYKEYINPGLAQMLGLLNFDKRFVRASGMEVWDEDGNVYLDFLGAYGALNLGHNPPAVQQGLNKAQELPNLLQASLNAMAAALAHNLAQVTPGNLQRTFFCNSGAEAVEGALKMARIATGRQRIIYCEGAFHGKTLGALSVTGRSKYQQPFAPLIPGCKAVPYGDAVALENELVQGDVAAFIVEPIQGEGGVIVPPEGYLAKAREICSRYGTLLIVDEIQTGFGRTGKLFACEHEDVTPDILCLAKSLGGGMMPIGATVTTPEVWDKAYGSMDKALLHTSTFGGNTRAMAAGIAAITAIVEQDLPRQAQEKGQYFIERLKELQEKHNLITEVRGRGLLIGLEFAKPKGLMDRLTRGAVSKFSQEYLGAMVAGELLNRYRIINAYTLNNPNVIRLEPPLIVTKEQIDQVLEALDDIFTRNRSHIQMALSSTKTVVSSLFGKK